MRMGKCGWENEDDKMQMGKCGWENADGKITFEVFSLKDAKK